VPARLLITPRDVTEIAAVFANVVLDPDEKGVRFVRPDARRVPVRDLNADEDAEDDDQKVDEDRRPLLLSEMRDDAADGAFFSVV